MAKKRKQSEEHSEPQQTDSDPTIEILKVRNRPLAAAQTQWGNWSYLAQVITLRRRDTREHVAVSLELLLDALRRVGREGVIDEIDAEDPLLPATKEILACLRETGSTEQAAAILEGYETHPSAREIRWEVEDRLWNQIFSRLDVNGQILRGCLQASDAVEVVLEGKSKPATLNEAGSASPTSSAANDSKVAPPVLTEVEVEFLRILIERPAEICLTSSRLCELFGERKTKLSLPAESDFRTRIVPRLIPWGLVSHGKRGYSLPADATARERLNRGG